MKENIDTDVVSDYYAQISIAGRALSLLQGGETFGNLPSKLKQYLSFIKKEREGRKVKRIFDVSRKTTPAEVAKITKIGRPTVYNLVKSLISKGVIAEDKADVILHLVPLPPEGLRATIERSKVELLKKEELS